MTTELDASVPPPTFDLREPDSVDEALAMLADATPDVRPIAGGTALMLLMRYGYFWPETLVSLRRLDGELGGIHRDADGTVRIGATTTLRQLEKSRMLAEQLPVLVDTLGHLANVRVRNVATIGGHLAHGDPHMDLPPVLMALDASVRIAGVGGSRWVPVADLYEGYYETAVADGELLTDVVIPAQRCASRTLYRKFSALSADDWPTLGVAVSTLGNGDADRLSGVRVAVSALGDRVLRLTAIEALLEGQRPSLGLFREAAAAAATTATDEAGSYMAELIRVEVRRALVALCADESAGRGAR